MRAKDIHAAVESSVGEPVSWPPINGALADYVLGTAPISCEWRGAGMCWLARVRSKTTWTNERIRSPPLKRLTAFADASLSARLRGNPHITRTYATRDSPQLSRRADGPLFARRLRSECASRSATVRHNTKCRRSDAEASEGATWLSCRKVRVPTERLEHSMLPAWAVCYHRRGKLQRSHNCVRAQGGPQSPYVV
jgi:hypothetical protein